MSSFDTKGAMAGAGMGAMAGTMVMPGVGTAVGAGAGLLLGGFMGNDLSAQSDPYFGERGQTESRGLQGNTFRMANMAAQGRGPSAAQQMVEQNRAQNANRAIGMAKSMGGDPGLANRMASEQIQAGNAQASYQGAVLRAREQQEGMALAAQQANAMRGDDVQMAQMRKEADQANKENRAAFLGGMFDSAGSMMGALM